MSEGALRTGTLAAVAVGGVAALSWEVLWQTHAALSLGISALGTALTLAATMGGMTIGSFWMGHRLKAHRGVRPLRAYAYLEATIGVSGLLLVPGFALVSKLDEIAYGFSPGLAPVVHILCIALLLGPPTISMGATVPVFELMGRATGSSIARLYAVNTAGAAVGVLTLTFLLVPMLGVVATGVLVAAINGSVCMVMLAFDRRFAPFDADAASEPAPYAPPPDPNRVWIAPLVVFGTGFVTFALEVAWFRSLRAAFQSTTETFALILAAVLIPLAVGARLVPWLRARGIAPRALLGLAAIAILLSTPVVERMDLTGFLKGTYIEILAMRWGLVLLALGPPVLLIGTALPWYLEEIAEPRRAGRLYAFNTLGAVTGSLGAAWILLPSLGFSRAAWLLGLTTATIAIASYGRRSPVPILVGSAAALVLAVHYTSSLGRDRVQSSHNVLNFEIIDFAEGPDSTVAVVESPQGIRSLLIDGFGASSEHSNATAYMDWMGHLPMALHPDPKSALVICFGTGLTANAVRNEGPETLDLVDVNSAVFEMAPHFRTNDRVLEDERVRKIVMDGRAWLRRTGQNYDVITLEPMPPYFSGVNALYSLEFYETIAEKLSPGGVVAQWLPIHLVPPFHSASVVATFHAVFPDSILWFDPYTSTGILLGRVAGSAQPLGQTWPGFARDVDRLLPHDEIEAGIVLNQSGVALYGEEGEVITDDNQILAYGLTRRELVDRGWGEVRQDNIDTIKLVSSIQLR